MNNRGNTNTRRDEDQLARARPRPIINNLGAALACVASMVSLQATAQRAPSFDAGPGRRTIFTEHDKARRLNAPKRYPMSGARECARRRRQMQKEQEQ